MAPRTDTIYKIVLFFPSVHIGGVEHNAYYRCGFWRTLDNRLIALHRDVKSWDLV